jgi:hypothetical protein
MNTQQLQSTEAVGGYFAVGAIINLVTADLAKYDVALHGLASLLTAIAAVASIVITLRRRK